MSLLVAIALGFLFLAVIALVAVAGVYWTEGHIRSKKNTDA